VGGEGIKSYARFAYAFRKRKTNDFILSTISDNTRLNELKRE